MLTAAAAQSIPFFLSISALPNELNEERKRIEELGGPKRLINQWRMNWFNGAREERREPFNLFQSNKEIKIILIYLIWWRDEWAEERGWFALLDSLPAAVMGASAMGSAKGKPTQRNKPTQRKVSEFNQINLNWMEWRAGQEWHSMDWFGLNERRQQSKTNHFIHFNCDWNVGCCCVSSSSLFFFSSCAAGAAGFLLFNQRRRATQLKFTNSFNQFPWLNWWVCELMEWN